MFNHNPTLASRVSNLCTLLVIACFLLFSLATIFILYSMEDAMFNQQLKQADTALSQGKRIAGHIRQLDDLADFSVIVDSRERFGEFSVAGKHYHYIKTSQGAAGYLLLEVTGQSIIGRSLHDIGLILLGVFMLTFLLATVLAKKLSQRALKPFTQLTASFSSHNTGHNAGHNASASAISQAVIADIKEHDIKLLADTLQTSLNEKAQLAEEKLTFNQGMSHELRSPLQVMTHSLELMSAKMPELTQLPAFARLEQAMLRMQRISVAFLWLTSSDQHQQMTPLGACVQQISGELADVLTAHNTHISVTIKEAVSFNQPAAVCELIIANLITNAIHHAKPQQGTKQLTITIDHHGIELSNEKASADQTGQPGFGIGLSIVKKLAQRFDIHFEQRITANTFSVYLRQTPITPP